MTASCSGREQRLNRFIGTLREIGEISPGTAQHAWQAWQLLKAAVRTLAVPDSSSGRYGEFLRVTSEGKVSAVELAQADDNGVLM